MSVVVAALGSALPPSRLSQDDAALHARDRCCTTEREARLLATLYRRSGVKQRRTVVGAEDPHAADLFFPVPGDASDAGPTTQQRMARFAEAAPVLASEASAAALAAAGLTPAHVTHLVTVSCTGFAAPGVDVALIRGLGLPTHVQRTNVGFMGCHGALNGLRVAAALATADPSAVVLLCCVELCSLHFAYGWDQERVVANALFGDGAAAAVVTGETPGPAAWRVAGHAAGLIDGTADAMTWTIGDHGFAMTLSPAVPEIIGTHLPAWIEGWLATYGLSVEAVGSWAVHPGGPRVLDAVQACLGLDADALASSRAVLAHAGNVSSATLLLILERLTAAVAEAPCVLLAFGPGLTIEAALLR